MSDGDIEKIDLEKVDWRGSREFFESLGDALDKLDDHDESYDFTWVGKRKSIIEAGAPINKTLRPDVENSKNWDTTENLFIEGDNLDALKLLQESYLGKVKMIYIDPPYNTGKDFVYHDNFRADTEQYDEDTEYKDDEGNIQFKKNEKTNGRYHSDWLSMMYPRLKLARNLLSDDGVIFISIDDNEQANLKKLCDEVFGEDNFLGNIAVVNNLKGRSDDEFFATSNEYMLCYARSSDTAVIYGLELPENMKDEYKLSDDISNYKEVSLQKTGKNSRRIDRPNMYYEIFYNPDTLSFSLEKESGALGIHPTPINGVDGCWRWGKDTFLKKKDTELTARKIGENWRVYVKMRDIVDGEVRTLKPKTTWIDPKYDTGNGGRSTKELFDNKGYFDNPKSPYFITDVLRVGSNKECLILDFFSGSATTAHAVMQLNAEDGGNRKWIMVQLPEETDEKSEAYKAGYKTIPEISRERIRRAGDKIASEHPDAKVDYGFRALRIDDTNHKDVYRPAADYQQNMLDDLIDNIKEDRSALDLLYGVLSQSAFELNRPMETIQIDTGATLYKYDYFGEVSGLVACFDSEVTEETIKQIAQLKPLTAVFREDSFPNSQAKVNLAEHFRIISPDTKVKVI